MPVSTAKDVVRQFASALSAGDIDGVIALYEPDGAFLPPGASGGDALRGRDAIRPAIEQFLAMKPKMTANPLKVVEVGDIALVAGEWTVRGDGPEGDVDMSGTFVNLMRRQPDGIWLCLLDNPGGVA